MEAVLADLVALPTARLVSNATALSGCDKRKTAFASRPLRQMLQREAECLVGPKQLRPVTP